MQPRLRDTELLLMDLRMHGHLACVRLAFKHTGKPRPISAEDTYYIEHYKRHTADIVAS